LVKGVTMMRPGEMLAVDLATGKELRRSTYWHWPAAAGETPSRAGAVEQLREVVTGAVKLHLASDAPLGLFLSGGIDSSALLALASASWGGTLRTLTIGFDSTSAGQAGRTRSITMRDLPSARRPKRNALTIAALAPGSARPTDEPS